LVQFRQGFASLSAPTAEFLRLVSAGRLHHGGNPVARWEAANLITRSDPAGNLKPDKAKSMDKIDGIVAAIMALDRAIRRETVEPEPEYAAAGF
jgi:phage terminase large subunit-like protein